MFKQPASNKTFSLTSSAANLHRLNSIRLIILTAITLTLSYTQYSSGNSSLLLYPIHSSLSAFYLLATLLTLWRLRQTWPVTDLEYFAQLLLDITIISILLYFSGGASNPFVSYYLVTLCISAAILPWHYTWLIAGCSLSAYTLMLFYNEPLPLTITDQHHHGSSSFNQHVLGMWFNFALSAGLITYFVVKMAKTLRQKEAQLMIGREDTLRDEQILAVATLAAGTAHELGTPLSTMTILLEELQQEHGSNKLLSDDITLLQQQLESCRSILKGLVSTAETHSHKQRETKPLVNYLQQLLNHWQVLRPEVSFTLDIDRSGDEPNIGVDTTLEQAILNLLNNAADAEPKNIHIHLIWNTQQFVLKIQDKGSGIPLDIAEQLGKPFITTKGKGLGLGLFLSHATVQRYGGHIELYNHQKVGTVAELQIPFANQ